MNNSPDGGAADEMAAALAQFAEQRDQLAVFVHELESTIIDVSTDDGSITVSTTLGGAITGLQFKDDVHRTLDASELAARLLTLLVSAREIAAEQAERAAGPLAEGPGLAENLVPGDPLGDALASLEDLFRPRRP